MNEPIKDMEGWFRRDGGLQITQTNPREVIEGPHGKQYLACSCKCNCCAVFLAEMATIRGICSECWLGIQEDNGECSGLEEQPGRMGLNYFA